MSNNNIDYNLTDEEYAQMVADDLSQWLENKSKHGFYAGLSQTIYSEGSTVRGSGLTKYISDKRNLVDDYLQEQFPQSFMNK